MRSWQHWLPIDGLQVELWLLDSYEVLQLPGFFCPLLLSFTFGRFYVFVFTAALPDLAINTDYTYFHHHPKYCIYFQINVVLPSSSPFCLSRNMHRAAPAGNIIKHLLTLFFCQYIQTGWYKLWIQGFLACTNFFKEISQWNKRKLSIPIYVTEMQLSRWLCLIL